jgi:hypothetical protein
VHGQPFVSFPALDRADGALKVRSYLLPGIQTIVSCGIYKNGGAVAFSPWTPGLPGTLLTQVSWPEEWMMVTCSQRSHQLLSHSHRMEISFWPRRYSSSSCCTFLPRHIETMHNVV